MGLMAAARLNNGWAARLERREARRRLIEHETHGDRDRHGKAVATKGSQACRTARGTTRSAHRSASRTPSTYLSSCSFPRAERLEDLDLTALPGLSRPPWRCWRPGTRPIRPARQRQAWASLGRAVADPINSTVCLVRHPTWLASKQAIIYKEPARGPEVS